MRAESARPASGSAPVRLAVDAGDLVRDRRGIGRLARAALAAFAGDRRLELELLADARDEAALCAEFADVPIARKRIAHVRDRYDVVWYPFNGMRFACRAPAVVTMHDAFAFTDPHRDFVARYRERAPIRRAARLAARVATTCAWTRDELARELRLDATQIAIVRPEPDPFFSSIDGATPSASGAALPEGLRPNAFALVVGVREARKNVRLALDACALAQRDDPDDRLAIVGELTETDRAYARARDVRFREIAANDELLRELYRNARVVLVPSLAEGFGLVPLEAMACGAIVLAARAAALPESTRGAAPLLDPRDPRAWADAMSKIARDEAFARELRAAALAAFAGDDRMRFGREMTALIVATANAGRASSLGARCLDDVR